MGIQNANTEEIVGDESDNTLVIAYIPEGTSLYGGLSCF